MNNNRIGTCSQCGGDVIAVSATSCCILPPPLPNNISYIVAYLQSQGQNGMAVKLIWLEEKYNQLINKKEFLESEEKNDRI